MESDASLLSSENTPPSSPTVAVFSDEAAHASSPPSSPPGFPWEKDDAVNSVAKNPTRPAKSAFALLGKRKALDSVSENVRPAKRSAVAARKLAGKTLTQMQISLGQEVQKKCKTCGMEYVPSSTEDRRLHDRYHKQNTEGYDVGKDFVQKARHSTVFRGANAVDSICALDCFDKPARKRRGQAVLEIVQRELGAVEIPERDIWDLRESDGRHERKPEYRIYLYIRGSKCIGCLLVQRIKEAYQVVEPPMRSGEYPKMNSSKTNVGALPALKARKEAAEEQLRQLQGLPITLSKYATSARLGISRIWTSTTHRHQNVATTLLDTAFKCHGQPVEEREAGAPVMSSSRGKEDVAFSQPTEAGTRLARRWFRKLFGWKVYVD